jgi:hypothetical protein
LFAINDLIISYEANAAILRLANEEKVDPYGRKKMKSSVRIIMLAALAATCICSQAYAGAKAVVGGAFAVPLLDAKTAVGKDGLLRLIFDYNPSTGGSTYAGSALWIIDPNSTVVAAGNPSIPASVGSFYFSTKGGSPIFPVERSNTAMYPQADGNTTVIFYYGLGANPLLGVTSFGVWTYNSGGNLIAAANYGPYGGTRIFNLYFDDATGKIVVKWATGSGASRTYAGWVIDEFGTVVSATGYYGPFGPSSQIGKFRINASNQLIWPFSLPNGSGDYTTVIWTFNSGGSALVKAQSYGPF